MRALRLLFTLIVLCVLSTPAHAQSFGGSLAMSEGHVFVGETGNAGFPGEVYVFKMSNMEEYEVLSLDDGFRGDRFGSALAYDGTQLLIGARSVNDGAGAIYLYSEKEGMWQGTGTLPVSSLGQEDEFGRKLILKDGLLAVAATGHKEQAGGVYLFKKTAEGNWELTALLTAGDAEPGDAFGTSIALSEDMLAVSAPRHDSSRGAVYVYAYDAKEDAWQEKTKLSNDEM
ncbi:MAG: FG-GAP repeat protein, partial [Rhodothermaceae bacterium]|nr:FG-GAP repeat protein [Rhodothermaceae bacterium]